MIKPRSEYRHLSVYIIEKISTYISKKFLMTVGHCCIKKI